MCERTGKVQPRMSLQENSVTIATFSIFPHVIQSAIFQTSGNLTAKHEIATEAHFASCSWERGARYEVPRTAFYK